MHKSPTEALAKFDAEYAKSRSYVLGIDEAGRGALAGPVVAGAVAISSELYKNAKFIAVMRGADDSKKLSSSQRDEVFKTLESLKASGGLDFEAGFASVAEIEEHNILSATRMAMARAAAALDARMNLRLSPAGAPATLFGERGSDLSKAVVILDGKPMKNFPYAHIAVVKGDSTSLAVAAASIVAKVSRDRLMIELAKSYPRYGFEVHKGYGTAAHMQALIICGASLAHRPSFLKKLRADTIIDRQGELF